MSKTWGFDEKLTDEELHDLTNTVNERRTGSTHVKVSAVALQHLLFDYSALHGLNKSSFSHEQKTP